MRIPLLTSRLTARWAELEGLASAEVQARRERYGDNVILEVRRVSLAERLREIAADPMLWFLAIAALVYLWLGERVEAAVLLFAMLPLVGMDAFLHRRTRASTSALESQLSASATVVRDGRELRLLTADLVVGDLVKIQAGDPVPADGIFIHADGLQVEEASLTGEAVPVRKRTLAALPPPLASAPEAAPVESQHWGLAGTRALAGSGSLRVVRTGAETVYGEIVRSAQSGARERTPLESSIAKLVGVLSVAAVVLCLLLAGVRWYQGYGWADALLSAATLAVAALPEEFPVAFTFFLAAGVYRLARRQALVRRAVSIENIGRASVICSDKTGTLTEGRLAVTQLEPSGSGTAEDLLGVSCRASREESSDPLDTAILEEAGRRNVRPARAERVAVFPFTEERRRETVVWREAGELSVATKGAPEQILRLCDLAESERQDWLRRIGRVAGAGGKPIGCASRRLPTESWSGDEPSSGFAFAGLVICADPVRPGAREAVRACRDAGLHTILVTGDHPATAAAVAREVGMGDGAPRVILGDQLEDWISRGGAAREIDVVARTFPAQKAALVRALQDLGESVVVTGDGVNDVPALRAADVGVAVGAHATRSAREVASIVVLSDDFTTIVGAIAEGRRVFAHLRASFEYLLLIHIPLVLSAALIPLGGYPLLYLPIHIVWLELVIHPSALLAFQPEGDAEELVPVPRSQRTRFFSVRDWVAIASTGAATTAVVIGVYLYGLAERGSELHARSLALAVLMLASALFVGLLTGFRTRVAMLVAGATLAGMAFAIHVPVAGRFLHLESLRAGDWAVAILASLLAAATLAVERGARLLRSRRGRGIARLRTEPAAPPAVKEDP
jgi:P-type Ca2+ transporter type 2C